MPSPPKKRFRLGKSHESDVRISDTSLSKDHAVIKFKSNQFYLEDKLSKFGTLVLVRSAYRLEPSFTAAVQIDRTVISFNVKNLSYSGERVFSAAQVEGQIKDPTAYDWENIKNPNSELDHLSNVNVQLGTHYKTIEGEVLTGSKMKNSVEMDGSAFIEKNPMSGSQMPTGKNKEEEEDKQEDEKET